MIRASGKFAAAAVLALIAASCARHHAVAVEMPVAPIPPRPTLNVAYDGVVVPALDADGHYHTLNAGIGPEQTIWHVRAALNVAALSCRGPNDAGIIPAYNDLLKRQKTVLAKANKAVEGLFRANGGDWQDAHDRYMTQLYNFFAMPQASVPFCRTAATLAPRAAETAAADFPAFAQTALMELEAPIVAVYQTIDATKTQMADWDARYGPNAPKTVQVAEAAPVAMPAKPAKKGKPKLEYHLDYEPIDVVFDWSPHRGTRVALR